MSLYDIINEISATQVTKTETGDTRVSGVMLGVVAQNYHEDMPGRVCVTIPTRDANANELKWARLAQTSGGSDWGHYFMPEIGDQVLLVFEGGNIEKPYVIGCVPKDSAAFMRESVDEKNQKKRIVTKHGSTILFEDHKDDEKGEKDKITIQTAGGTHVILLDNENKKIRVSDKSGKNFLEMSTEENSGAMKIKVESNLTIEVGDGITLTMNGSSGGITLKGKQISLEADQNVSVKGNDMIALEAQQISEKANSMYKVESGGSVSIAGSIIKIG